MKFRMWSKNRSRFLTKEEAVTYAIVTHEEILHGYDIEIDMGTGITDQNDKEIYDKDILLSIGGSFLGVVEFKRGCFGIRITYDQHFIPFCEVTGPVIVAGNIREKPLPED